MKSEMTNRMARLGSTRRQNPSAPGPNQTKMSVVEVGVASGFGSTERFSRFFKSAFEVSPAADRRAVRGPVPTFGT